jgi:hypothetical protein
MELDPADLKKLQELEESMWLANTRFDKEYMERTLAPDFFEFGRSGRVYKKEETISAPAQEIKAKLPLKNFEARLIAPMVALVTYISEVDYDSLEVANRSSIWVKASEEWQLKFHQGTPVNP